MSEPLKAKLRDSTRSDTQVPRCDCSYLQGRYVPEQHDCPVHGRADTSVPAWQLSNSSHDHPNTTPLCQPPLGPAAQIAVVPADAYDSAAAERDRLAKVGAELARSVQQSIDADHPRGWLADALRHYREALNGDTDA